MRLTHVRTIIAMTVICAAVTVTSCSKSVSPTGPVAGSRVFSTLDLTSYHVPALVSVSQSGGPPDTAQRIYLSFPYMLNTAKTTDSTVVSDTLHFFCSRQIGRSTTNTSTISIRCVIDTVLREVRYLSLVYADNCNGCNDPHESSGTSQTLVLHGIPFVSGSGASRTAEIRGAAAVQAVDTCSFSTGWFARGYYASTGLRKLLPGEDSTYFRVVLH